MPTKTPTALVTGASSGIGAATARRLAAEGFLVHCSARRADRLEALAEEIGGVAVPGDVTDPDDVARIAASVGDSLDVLVNNAGGAFGLSTLEDADPQDWRRMFELNALGTLQVTQALLPALRTSGRGIVVNLGSTAGHEPYEKGGGYVVAKHAVAAMTRMLRRELFGEPVRVCEIAPGMVQTEEFSLNRFEGDQERADAVYAGVEAPLVADDVADAIAWVATRPAHVDVELMVVRPRAQISQYEVQRSTD